MGIQVLATIALIACLAGGFSRLTFDNVSELIDYYECKIKSIKKSIEGYDPNTVNIIYLIGRVFKAFMFLTVVYYALRGIWS